MYLAVKLPVDDIERYRGMVACCLVCQSHSPVVQIKYVYSCEFPRYYGDQYVPSLIVHRFLKYSLVAQRMVCFEPSDTCFLKDVA